MNMTENDAKKEIEHNVFCNTDDFEMKISKECYKTIINALEKQIKKKVERYSCNTIGEMTFNCPSCNLEYYVTDYEDFNYCPNCGQKIDWRVEERNEKE